MLFVVALLVKKTPRQGKFILSSTPRRGKPLLVVDESMNLPLLVVFFALSLSYWDYFFGALVGLKPSSRTEKVISVTPLLSRMPAKMETAEFRRFPTRTVY